MSPRISSPRISSTRILFALTFVALLGVIASPVGAAADAVKFEDARRDLEALGGQLKDKKIGNEDLIGTLDALAKAFYVISFDVEPPAALAEGADEEAKKAHAAQVKAYEDAKKKHAADVKEWQEKCLDQIFKALKLVAFNPRNNENMRNDVNLKAAQVLGDLLADPRLAEGRDAKEVAKERESWSKSLMGLLAGDLEEPKQEYLVPVAVLESAFGALGKINDHDSLKWLLDNYSHTNNAQAKVERLRAAHKAMILFKGVEGPLRYQIVEKFITIYTAAEASANNNAASGADAKAKSAAAAAKKFWDDVKTDTIAVVNHFATGPDNQPPSLGEGQALTSMKELNEWWSKHNKRNKAPWLDEKVAPSK
jgi:hypothetical protein